MITPGRLLLRLYSARVVNCNNSSSYLSAVVALHQKRLLSSTPVVLLTRCGCGGGGGGFNGMPSNNNSSRNNHISGQQQARTMETSTSRGFAENFFEPSQNDQILAAINNKSEEELKALSITGNILNTIITTRPYPHLSKFYSEGKMNIIKFTSVCEKILAHQGKNNRTNMQNSTFAKLCHPQLTAETVQAIESVLVVDIHLDRFSAIQMSPELKIQYCANLPTLRHQKSSQSLTYNHVEYFKEVQLFVEGLPEADAYILEAGNPRVRPNFMAIDNAVKLLQATFATHMMSKSKKVYFIKRKLVDSTFNLTVGGERVSPRDIVTKIVQEEQWSNHPIGNIQLFKMAQRQNRNHSFRDGLGQLLLQSIAFTTKVCMPLLETSNSKKQVDESVGKSVELHESEQLTQSDSGEVSESQGMPS